MATPQVPSRAAPIHPVSTPRPTQAATPAAKPSAKLSATLSLDLWTKDLPREHGFEPLRVEGSLPPALRGTLYRNGPAQFGQFGRRYAHPFEGDGGVTAVRIADGAAMGASRLTPSAGLLEERAAGKQLYSTTASWLTRMSRQLRGRRKNTANTSVVMWQGRLFALMEGGKPTELDPGDLSMIGETDLDGVIVDMFSAHPHRVESRHALYNFGIEMGRVNRLHLYELPDAGAARRLGSVEIGGATMVHDFIATDSHLIFFVGPARFNLPGLLLGQSFDKLVKWRPELGTEVICVPFDRPDAPVRFTTDAFYQWHFANAYRHGNELLVDYVRYPDFGTFDAMSDFARGHAGSALEDGRYHRARIDLVARTLVSEPLSDRPCEFPGVATGEAGYPHALTYLAFDDLGAIGSIDARGTIVSHELPADERITEPLYVDGYLLALCHATDRAYVAVYDAARIPDGPVAKLWLDHHVPITFHGTFHSTPAATR
ncbi:MAG TPA: carotenoid oxygenase family protein [Kofleriaceae bacterium]